MSSETNVDLAVTALRQVQVHEGRAGLTNPQLIALAQTHATLALVEEQRIANSIAALHLGTAALDHDNKVSADPKTARRVASRNALRRLIREGLGL
ncbi:hypothetical protein Q9R08_05005 [Microbacterium sp. QXD-8]|uniref:DUF222 domain-containing protein n=1 Tax=Microbacterium psychrotolerans TaxID=3068321 RepID=A0ABU0Z0K0_9MICO|nr:hypothetical protein [Microbacterium sp. QXD-8]MDQ7877331.1 hypothetical protein [Microbacterium sp. QXD-8]